MRLYWTVYLLPKLCLYMGCSRPLCRSAIRRTSALEAPVSDDASISSVQSTRDQMRSPCAAEKIPLIDSPLPIRSQKTRTSDRRTEAVAAPSSSAIYLEESTYSQRINIYYEIATVLGQRGHYVVNLKLTKNNEVSRSSPKISHHSVEKTGKDLKFISIHHQRDLHSGTALPMQLYRPLLPWSIHDCQLSAVEKASFVPNLFWPSALMNEESSAEIKRIDSPGR